MHTTNSPLKPLSTVCVPCAAGRGLTPGPNPAAVFGDCDVCYKPRAVLDVSDLHPMARSAPPVVVRAPADDTEGGEL